MTLTYLPIMISRLAFADLTAPFPPLRRAFIPIDVKSRAPDKKRKSNKLHISKRTRRKHRRNR